MRKVFLSLGLLAALAMGGIGVAHAGDGEDSGSSCDLPPCCRVCK